MDNLYANLDNNGFISDVKINEIENGSFTFEEKYVMLIDEYEAILDNYNDFDKKIQEFIIVDNDYLKEYNYLYDGIHYYIDEIENILEYTTDLITEEINKEPIINNFSDINNYVEKTEEFKNLSDKLVKVRGLRFNNYYNTLMIDKILLCKIAIYKYVLISNYFEDNSKKGISIIVNLCENKFIYKSKEIYIDKLDEFKKIFIDFINDSKNAYNICNKIQVEIIEKNRKCNYVFVKKDFIGLTKYFHEVSNYTLESYLNKFKEPENQYNVDCPICLNEVKEDKCITNCGHVYCLSCIKTYLDNENKICPMCKEDL
jgi:hypothetical protein